MVRRAILGGTLSLLVACGGPEAPGAGASGGTAGAGGEAVMGGMAAQGGVGGSTPNGDAGDGAGTDSAGQPGAGGLGGGVFEYPACAPGSFSEPELVEELNIFATNAAARLTGDELTVVYRGNDDLYIADRLSRDDPFGEPRPLGDLGLPGDAKGSPWLSDDRLTLLFELNRSNTYIAHRASVSDDFDPAEPLDFGPLDPLDLGGEAFWDPFVVGGANGTFFGANDDGFRAGPLSDWTPGAMTAFSWSEGGDQRLVVSHDGSLLYFEHDDTIFTTWPSPMAGEYSTPTALNFDAPGSPTLPSWISPDCCRLYFDTWDGPDAQIYRMSCRR